MTDLSGGLALLFVALIYLMSGAGLVWVIATLVMTFPWRCRHVAPDGSSLLRFIADPARGRLRGECNTCGHRTPGWEIKRPIAPRPWRRVVIGLAENLVGSRGSRLRLFSRADRSAVNRHACRAARKA